MLFVILRFATHRLRWLRRQGALTGLFMLFYGLFRIRWRMCASPTPAWTTSRSA